MKDDKKKLIVVVALALVIVAVGVFQFVAGGSPAPAPVAAKKEVKKPEPVAEAVEAPKNPMFATNLPARDPFKEPAIISAELNPVKQQTEPQPRPQPAPTYRAPALPDGMINKSGGFDGGSVAPVNVKVEGLPEAQFGFRLSGVMLGAKPMAVFTDGSGNQRLVMLGGSLDPESKVLAINKDAVTVRFHGKTLKLTVEGNPNDK